MSGRKDYPAKAARGRRRSPLRSPLDVPVQRAAGVYTASVKGKSATSHVSAAHTVRVLARLLGYSVHADVRYVRTQDSGAQQFQIVEVQP